MILRIGFGAAILLLAGLAGGAGAPADAQETNCWLCGSTPLDWGEYCPTPYPEETDKHAFYGTWGHFEGPAHAGWMCGVCASAHNPCWEEGTAAAQALRRAIGGGGDVEAVLAAHPRFVRLDRPGKRVVVHDCEGRVTESIPLAQQQMYALGE